jgi:3',5'-cyclic AMP phosphodiesterase CpdA
MPKLYAISDLHLGHQRNRDLLSSLSRHDDDWLIVAGDVGETDQHLEHAWNVLCARFARVLWVPGNHELWTPPGQDNAPAGEARYQHLVTLCQRWGVLTPDDPWVEFEGTGGNSVLALMFLLYDYSFRPPEVSAEHAVEWAAGSGVVCADEYYLGYEPYASRQAWCHERVRLTERRLQQEALGRAPILVNHFPLRYDLLRIRRIPRFSIWCGTRETDDWHLRFGARCVVAGHQHVPHTAWRHGVRFEEVSLGYPRERLREKPADAYLRRIM